MPPPPGEKPYLCDKCGRGFNRVDNLRSHVKTVHQGKAGIKILEPEEGGEVSVVTVDDMVTLATEALAATAVTQLTGSGNGCVCMCVFVCTRVQWAMGGGVRGREREERGERAPASPGKTASCGMPIRRQDPLALGPAGSAHSGTSGGCSDR